MIAWSDYMYDIKLNSLLKKGTDTMIFVFMDIIA